MVEYFHSTGLGKAILANLPRDQVDEIIAQHGLPKQTENTITDINELFKELDQTRERGYAKDDEESVDSLWCVTSPVIDSNNVVLGAVSVSGPISRIQGDKWEDEFPTQVKSTGNIIVMNTEHSHDIVP